MKQTVFVPEYPGKPVYEGYHGIPHNQFAERAREAARKFTIQQKCSRYSIRTVNGTFYYNDVTISGDNETIMVNGHSIKPTKWGVDWADSLLFRKRRIWFFNDVTLDELDLVCDKK